MKENYQVDAITSLEAGSSQRPLRVWLISAFEPIPSDGVRPMRFMGLADALLARGHEVVFWTSSFAHAQKAQRFQADTSLDVSPRYRVVVLKSKGYTRNISPQRFAAHRQFAGRLRSEMQKTARPDLIFTSLPPLDTVSAAQSYGRAHGVPVVVDVIDPWPDVFLAAAPRQLRSVARVALSPLHRQAATIFRSAAAVSAISSTYVEWAERLAGGTIDRTNVSYPAVDISGFDRLTDKLSQAARNFQGETLKFVYAGALSSSYDVETIIAVARQLATEGCSQAEFQIAGSGPKLSSLQALAEGLPNVRFLGWLGAEALAEAFAAAHVGIACYRRGATQSVTYKLFDYLSAGLPILCSLPGEMSDLIEQEKVGLAFEPETPAALAAVVRQLCADRNEVEAMSRRARRFAETSGNAPAVYGRLAAFLEEIVAARPAAQSRPREVHPSGVDC